ncbi:MAG TPA: carbon-nitrogen hydrolase family protein, partial [Planctomycetes bacterium]|nr:carbon-nitrogen hydrolase family protein [Planctomycetota bacterium]
MPITSCLLARAVRTTARTHAFIPGASPPLQKTPIRMLYSPSLLMGNTLPFRLVVVIIRTHNLFTYHEQGSNTMTSDDANSEKNLFEVVGVQMDVQLGDVDANLAAIAKHLNRAADEGAHLVVFPECALTGYCFDSLEQALPYGQPVPGPATDAVIDVCVERDIFAMFGMLERADDGFFNACVLVGPKGDVG